MHSSRASAGQCLSSGSHSNMELLTGSELFLSYSRTPLAPASTMEQLKESSGDVSDDIQNGALPESPGLGVSGSNPRLVNGEAVSTVVSEADVQRLSAQSVLKKVLSVSEAEELLQGSAVEKADGSVNGVQIDATSDSQAKVC